MGLGGHNCKSASNSVMTNFYVTTCGLSSTDSQFPQGIQVISGTGHDRFGHFTIKGEARTSYLTAQECKKENASLLGHAAVPLSTSAQTLVSFTKQYSGGIPIRYFGAADGGRLFGNWYEQPTQPHSPPHSPRGPTAALGTALTDALATAPTVVPTYAFGADLTVSGLVGTCDSQTTLTKATGNCGLLVGTTPRNLQHCSGRIRRCVPKTKRRT